MKQTLKTLNIKKVTSLLFHRTVLVAVLILIQAAVLLVATVFFSAYFIYFYWVCILLSLLAVLLVVNTQRDPGYKIAWLVPILLFPVFGWLVYLLCGGNGLTKGQQRRMQEMERKMVELLDGDCKAQRLLSFGHDAVNQAHYLEQYAHCPVYTNTYTQYFPLGDEVFPVMLEELRRAERFIFIEYFIIERGIFWNSIVEVLREKHAAGVDVRVLYDDVGSLFTAMDIWCTRMRS